MDREELLEGLEAAGLSAHEAAAYVVLLEHGVTPAVEVARRSSLPGPRIYDILDSLEERGYVETLERDRLHARPRNPVDVMDTLHHRSELLSNVAGEIEDRWEYSPLGTHEIEMTKRAETVFEHARGLIREAECTVDLALSHDRLADVEPALADLSFEDVYVRVSLQTADPGGGIDLNRPVCDVATEIRERPIPTPFLAIVDRDTVCFAPTARMPEPYGLIVQDTFLSLVFSLYFQSAAWLTWETIHHSDRPRAEYVTLEEFVLDVYPLWRDGAVVVVTVDGLDTNSGRRRQVSGTVTDIRYSSKSIDVSDPTLVDLASLLQIDVLVDDRTVTVGGWAAAIEDVEARRITLDAIVPLPSSDSANAPR